MPDDKPSPFIAGLSLSGRATKRLAQNGIETAHDFMGLDEETVMGWKQTGKTVWEEISKAQDGIDSRDQPVDAKDEDWDPLLGPPPSKPVDPKPEPKPDPAPSDSGDSVIGLIDWAIDAAAYDKKMCRDLLIRAKKMLRG